jgi:hypothetical protein
MILQTFVPGLGIGEINTIVANSEYDNDSMNWNVVVPPSVLKKNQVKPEKPSGLPQSKFKNRENEESLVKKESSP